MMRTRDSTRMSVRWKDNWEETKQHVTAWWERRGLVVLSWGGWGAPQADAPHEQVDHP